MKRIQFLARKVRVKAKLGTALPRLAVYRSNRITSAQIIDDSKRITLVAVNEKEVGAKGKKVEKARLAGELLAKKALAKKIKKVVFDKSGYLYHGRVAALAEGARKGGLDF